MKVPPNDTHQQRDTFHRGAHAANTAAAAVTSGATGVYSAVSLFESGSPIAGAIAGLAVGGVLFGCLHQLSYFGTQVLPSLPASKKAKALIAWLATSTVVAAVSIGTNAMLIATPQAEAEYVKSRAAAVIEKSSAVVEAQRAAESLSTTFETAKSVARTMLDAEQKVGGICSTGGGAGECTTALNGIVDLAANSSAALIDSKGNAAPVIRDIETLQDQIRRIPENDDFRFEEKVAALKTAVEKMRLLVEQLASVVPVAAIEQAIPGFVQEWKSQGISAVGASRFKAAFMPVGVQLTADIREIRAASEQEIPGFRQMNDVEVLLEEAQAVWPLLSVSAIFDLLPIMLVMLGLFIGRSEETTLHEPAVRGRSGASRDGARAMPRRNGRLSDDLYDFDS